MIEHTGTASALVAAAAVLFIGISKAGFGGGLGVLTTPLCVIAFGPKDAIGILLPLLCVGDVFSLYHYWGKWRRENLLYLLPGVVVGVLAGVQLIGRFSSRELNFVIGLLAIAFVVFQLTKERILQAEGPLVPGFKIGLPFGIGAGVTSTFAHGAGPVVTLFLLPQRMPKEIYVGTTVLVFTWINAIKLPFFATTGLVRGDTLQLSALYLPLVPVGVWAGVWLNRKVPERAFVKITYALTLIAGIQLVLNFNPLAWFK